MRLTLRHLVAPTAFVSSLFLVAPSPTRADERPSDESRPNVAAQDPAEAKEQDDVATLNLLDAVRRGTVSVDAEGTGDGRMTLSVTNKTKKKLRVVLPPGLIASGATGQFGGMGGMGGGGMGGMGGMGGGMGGMGGGMGGMGGGMGGMGGGMGGMGGGGMGGMGGGMGMGGGTMPASMGMMMLGQLIMSLVGDRDSWDQSSLMSGMMGGMGGGMGGMGGGMGGMGGGMGGMGGMGGGMGGRGGGFRSVPPTSLPFAALNPQQTRHLPTRLVGLSEPNADRSVAMPAKGEKLRVGDISQLTGDARVQTALKRLAEDKAPQTLAQLVMWRVASNLDWSSIATLSKKWANAQELALAQSFVDQLDNLPQGDSGTFLCEIKTDDPALKDLSREIGKALKDQTVLGLAVKSEIPAQPEGPGVACRIRLRGTEEKPQAYLEVATSNLSKTSWASAGKFTLPVVREAGKFQSAEFVDAMAEGMLDRLVRATVARGPKVKGKTTYKVRIENGSPLILNGIAVLGTASEKGEVAKVLSGISVAPGKSMTVPATGQMVDELGLKKGVRVTAADLSGL